MYPLRPRSVYEFLVAKVIYVDIIKTANFMTLEKIGYPKSDRKTGSAVYPHIRLFSGEMNLSLLVCFCTGALVAIVDAKVRALNEVHSCPTFYNKKYNGI